MTCMHSLERIQVDYVWRDRYHGTSSPIGSECKGAYVMFVMILSFLSV